MCRVLKKGGHLSIAELTTPVSFPMENNCFVFTRTPFCPSTPSQPISKDDATYSYLTKTIEAFPQGEQMVGMLKDAGFSEASFDD